MLGFLFTIEFGGKLLFEGIWGARKLVKKESSLLQKMGKKKKSERGRRKTRD